MIYLVEDDASIGEVEAYALKSAGYETQLCPDGAAFREAMAHQLPQLVVMDWMLPGESGLDLLHWLRHDQRTVALPVLLVTAKGSELDIVKGLDAGADDYLTKPFGVLEFISRVKALLRRAAALRTGPDTLTFGPIQLCPANHTLTVGDQPVELTYKEYALLELLMQTPGQVVSRETILARVWGMDTSLETRTLDMHIRTLRQKLGTAGALIQTVRKIGYKLAEEGHE